MTITPGIAIVTEAYVHAMAENDLISETERKVNRGLLSALRDYNMARRDLLAMTKELERSMADNAERIRRGEPVNSYGIVQGMGVRVDQLCALVNQNRQTVTDIARFVGYNADALIEEQDEAVGATA